MKTYIIEYLDDNGNVKKKIVFGQTEDQVREQAYKEYGRYGTISVKPCNFQCI